MRLHPFIPVLERADGAPDRQAAQDIVDRHDQTWGIMPTAGRRQAAVGIERLPDGLGGRQSVGGPIEREDGQAAPLILFARRKHLVRQRDRAAEHGRHGLPGQLGARLGQRAAVGAVPCGPQATPTRPGEAGVELGRHALVPGHWRPER